MFKPKALYCEKEIENYNLGRELLEKYADVVLIGHSNVIMEEKGLTVYSHLPLLIITETIINYLSTDAEAL